MTLEDFFTLTEMKDGLLALARVEELVSVMKEEKDIRVANIGEAARQWCTVASTLAATENKDSLDHFIRLDGLYFLDHWLQEAQKCSSEASDSSVEESIIALLGALEKLPIDNERSVSSGISTTVKNLFDVKSLMVQQRARALFDSWTQRSNKDADHQVEKNTGCQKIGVKPVDALIAGESGCLKHSVVESPPAERGADLVNHVDKPAHGSGHSRCSESSQSESVKDVKITSPNNRDTCQTTLGCVGNEGGLDVTPRGSSTVVKPCQENLTPSIGIHNSPAPLESNVEGRPLDVPELKALTKDEREIDVIKGSQDRCGKTELCSVSASSEHVSSSDALNLHHATKSTTQCNFDAKESESGIKKTLPADLDGDSPFSKPKIGMVDSGGQKHSRSTVEREATDQCYSNVLQDLSGSRNVLGKPEDMEASFSRKEDIGAINDVKVLAGESILKVGGGNDSATAADVSKSTIDAKVLDKIGKRGSDVELDYGVEDALEVARQVAKEVEREVVDYREEFCSSSEKTSGGVPRSPDSINGEHVQHPTGPLNEVQIGENLMNGALSPKEERHLINTENIDKPQDNMHEPESSQGTETAKKLVINTEKSMCDFDLNEELRLDEMDHPVTPSYAPFSSAPITVVSASKATAPGLPMAPLHFEGELGWKGSAATSAFRPAALRRTPDAERSVSIEGSSQSSKQRQDLQYIDLNVAEGDNGGATNPVISKQFPLSSDLQSGESSIEVSSRRAERLKLDLNRIGDNEETPSDWKMDGGFVYHQKNGHHSLSPASSTSSKPTSMRNFDLNDNPSFPDQSSDQQPDLGKASSLDMNVHGGAKLDDPVISIMGTRVEINKNEPVPQTRSFRPNGQVPEFLIGANFTKTGGSSDVRPAMAYAPSPIFGYNHLTAGSSVPLYPAMYRPGSVPYMVESRGAPVVPVMGSQVDAPPTYSRPQFLMSTTGPLSGLNGVVNPRPNIDLNSGLTVGETESREPGGLRQLLIPGQGVLMGEQMRSTSQPINSSGMGMRRKEPEGGWDLFPGGYKQKSPWH